MKNSSKIPKTFFLFLIASGFIWLLITFSKEYKGVISYKLAYQNIPQNKILQDTPIRNLDLSVRGSGFKILLARLEQKTIQLNADNLIKARNNRYYFLIRNQLSNIKNQLQSGIEIVDISKDTITLNLGSLTSKKVPVEANLEITYHVGYDLIEDIQLTPDSILVSGPEQKIKSLKKVPLTALKLMDVKGNFKEEVAIKNVTTLNNLKFDNNKVVISGKVDKFTEGSLQIPFIIRNIPDSIQITTLSEQVEFKFVVALSNFNKITKNTIQLECDFDNAQKNNLTYLIPKLTNKPEFIKSYKIVPNKIDFLIRK